MNIVHTLALSLAIIAVGSCAVSPPSTPDAIIAAAPMHAPPSPRVGMWLHPDIEIDKWICAFETNSANPPSYFHSKIQPSSWRQVIAHSSVVVLNNFIFGEPLPWSVLKSTKTYSQYLAEFEAFPPNSPEGLWYRRLNAHVRAPLAGLTQDGDPIAQKLIYIYSHMFGYDREHAISLGLTPIAQNAYAWPPKGLDKSWPASFLYDDGYTDVGLRPSFKKLETRAAMANAVFFFMRHFESLGAKVHLSPWREVNGYRDETHCSDDEKAKCGLDTWEDLYDTYQVILNRVGMGSFDTGRIAVYPTFQFESFIGAKLPCTITRLIDQAKQFYSRNLMEGVPFAIGLSTYPSVEKNGLDLYLGRLSHFLDNLDSSTPVACDANGDGVIAINEGIDLSAITTRVLVPRTTPLTIGETSLPPWATFQTEDTPSVMSNEKLGAALVNTHLNYNYIATDGTPSYPLEFVAFSLGPNWAFPAPIHGVHTWITSSPGLARNWLTPMQPLAGQLLLDAALDPDGDWDNDGVPSITFEKTDNCPYLPNVSQADADADGIGDLCDNCKNVANYAQEDWDQDGFGSACDADVNNDGLIQVEVDLAVVIQCQGAAIDCLAHVTFPHLPRNQSTPDMNGKVVLIADMDADEDVDEDDVTAWRTLAANASLRESGFDCAGTTPCPDPAVVMLRNGQNVTIPDPAPAQRECDPYDDPW